jgi:hypothetical protein
MTKKWTDNILTQTFGQNAEKTLPNSTEKNILSKVTPVARFFEDFGFKDCNSKYAIAQLWIASNEHIDLVARTENSAGVAPNHFNAINLTLNVKKSDTITYEHPLRIRVSLNEKDGGQYELIGGNETIVSGDPSKIFKAFIKQTADPLHKNILDHANARFTLDNLKQFKPTPE